MKGFYTAFETDYEDIRKLPDIVLTDKETKEFIYSKDVLGKTYYNARLDLYIAINVPVIIRKPKKYWGKEVFWSLKDKKEYFSDLNISKLYDFDVNSGKFYIISGNVNDIIKDLKLVKLDDYYDNVRDKTLKDINSLSTLQNSTDVI